MREDSNKPNESPLDWTCEQALEEAIKSVKENGHRQVLILLTTPGEPGFQHIRAGLTMSESCLLLQHGIWSLAGFQTREDAGSA